MNRISPVLWFWIRLIGAISISIVLLWSLDWSSLVKHARQINWIWWGGCIAIPLAGVALSAVKWQAILEVLGVQRSYGELLLRYWKGAFYNNVLPGSIGGDVIRISGLSSSGVPLPISALSVFVDRLTGLWVGMCVGLTACVWPSNLPYRNSLVLAFGCMVISGLLAVWIVPKFYRFIPQRFQRYVMFTKFIRHRRMWYIICLSFAFQLLVVLHLYAAAQALQTPLGLLACCIYAPAVVLTTLLPISLNGIGVREATLVFLLASNNVSPEAAALIGSTIYITTILSSLPGGLLVIKIPPFNHHETSQSPP
jgi:hypothetical protein